MGALTEELRDLMSDEALAEVGRVLLAITIERVTAANYIPSPTRQAETRR